MRLQSHIWVKAYIRRVYVEGCSALLIRRGETSAGAIFIKVNLLNGHSYIFSPAPGFLVQEDGDRQWYLEHGPEPLCDKDADDLLKEQISYDSDLWVIEVEDPEGRHFLADQFIEVSI